MAKEENVIQLDFLDGEIKIELSNQTPNDAEEAMPPEEHVGRKPFIIHDFDAPRDREMAVFTRAKKLSEYVFVITEKSPKKLRWSIVARLQNCSVDVIEYLYRANYERDAEPRREYQKRAHVALNLLDFFAETAKRKQAISMRQMTIIAREVSELKRLLNGWIKSARTNNG